MSNGFKSPDKFRDEAKSQAEEFDRKSNSYSNWKPKKGETPNQIRILPAKGNASFHLKVGKHFIKHEDGWEVFVCNYEIYGEPCPACEKYLELRKTDKEAAAAFKPQVRGVFNIIDRNAEEAGVQKWEAPASKIWRPVIEWFKGNTKFNNLVGTAKDPLEGRDLFIIFKPEEDPGSMYNVWPDQTSPLGTPEQVKKWLEEAEPLIAEKLYPEIDYNVASVLTFGSPSDRAEVKRILREAGQKEEVEEETGEKEVEESKTVKELKKQIADEQAKRKLAEAKADALGEKSPEEEKIEKTAETRAAKAEKGEKDTNTSTKKTSKVKEDVSVPEDIHAKVEEIRAKHNPNK